MDAVVPEVFPGGEGLGDPEGEEVEDGEEGGGEGRGERGSG